MRVVGLDIHRSFAEAAMIDEGRVHQLGRIDLVRERVIAFAKRLGKTTDVVVEATGNTMAVVKLMAPHVRRMVIANPLQVRAIAHAKVKTDKIDAVILAKLHVRRIPTGGLAARREHGTVTSSGRSAGDDRAVAYAGEEPGTERAA